MSPTQIADAIAAAEAAIANEARIDEIIGRSGVKACRNIPLGLTAAQSQPVLNAILSVLRSMPA